MLKFVETCWPFVHSISQKLFNPWHSTCNTAQMEYDGIILNYVVLITKTKLLFSYAGKPK